MVGQVSAPLLHAFGARYGLPIPLALYVYGAGTVVLVSFVLVTIFSSSRPGDRAARYRTADAPWLLRILNSRPLHVLGGLIGVVALLGAIVTGLLGAPQAARNPSAYLVWIFLWVSLALLCAVFGNVWTWLSPFRAIYAVIRPLLPAPRPLPARIGIWPACVLFFGIAWFELASGKAAIPPLVAGLAAGYALVMVAGMAVFGRDEWLERCDAFTVLFGIASRFGPLETDRDQSGRVVAARLRLWGSGLLMPYPASWDRVVFVILMLSNLAFDGIEATPLWFQIINQSNLALTFGGAWRITVYSVGIAAVALIFTAVFVLVMRLVIALGDSKVNALGVTASFALTLVPIALAYDLAHNYTYLLIYGQGFIPVLADPLARGWALLPVKGYQANLTLAAPVVVWWMQIALIVIGHVIAVVLAHRRSQQWFRGRRRALLSQYPMLLLMVGYTMTSLWILAQPITA